MAQLGPLPGAPVLGGVGEEDRDAGGPPRGVLGPDGGVGERPLLVGRPGGAYVLLLRGQRPAGLQHLPQRPLGLLGVLPLHHVTQHAAHRLGRAAELPGQHVGPQDGEVGVAQQEAEAVLGEQRPEDGLGVLGAGGAVGADRHHQRERGTPQLLGPVPHADAAGPAAPQVGLTAFRQPGPVLLGQQSQHGAAQHLVRRAPHQFPGRPRPPRDDAPAVDQRHRSTLRRTTTRLARTHGAVTTASHRVGAPIMSPSRTPAFQARDSG